MSPSAYIEAYKSIRKVLTSSVNNATNFCNTLSNLSTDKSKRLIINSADSIFDGIKIQETIGEKHEKHKFYFANSLAKIPKAVFLPRCAQDDSSSCNLPSILETTLNQIGDSDKFHSKVNLFLLQLRDTANYLSENQLQDNYGPLRPFLVDYLKKYQESLIACEYLKKPKKLHYCLTLMEVLKCFSIDSQDLPQTVKIILKDSPELVKAVPLQTFRYISKLVLDSDAENLFNERMKSIAYESLSSLIKHLGVVFIKFENKVDLETYLSAVTHKMKIETCSKEDIMELLRSLKVLGARHRDEDLANLTSSLLELIYPRVSNKSVATGSEYEVDKNDIVLIFETYMKITTKSTFSKNCHEALVNYVLDNKFAFTSTQLIRMAYSIGTSGSSMSKVLVKNEYVHMSEVANRLVNHLLSQLSTLEFNDLCLVLYAYPLSDYFRLYHILANYSAENTKLPSSDNYDEVRDKVMGIVKRRIVQNLDSNNANNGIYTKQVADSLLFKDYDFHEYFSADIKSIIHSLTKNQILEIVTTNNENRNLNTEVLNLMLDKLSYNLDNINKLEVLNNLAEKNNLVKLTTMCSDVELLLQCANKFDVFHPNIFPLLNYSYDLNISNAQNQVIINMLTCLKNLKIRHEPLIKKFTDKLLNSFKSSSNYYIPDLIAVTEALSSLCIPYNDLYMYLMNYLSVNAATDSETVTKGREYKEKVNSFSSLSLKDKISLLYSIANFGIVDHNLKNLYISVINEMYERESNESENGKEGDESMDLTKGSKLKDSETLLKLYEVHIDLVLNNIYSDEADAISKKLKHPSSLWFTREELKSQNFKKSNLYITVRDALNALDVKSESAVTEIYFCNFLVRDGDKSTVIYVVPNEDVLRFWTTNLETRSLEPCPTLCIGNSQKIIRNLKLLGYQVAELQQAKWYSLQSDRVAYLRQLLCSS
ncbi:conserved hypothetical protein [Theileria orientalis strain Shintoku]|uniref:RAP domain-containing protein n=1 Tax=Theileria orientalis strain Shintoku TaxID=869250 RepID=J4DP97_THEOR|nr:conserved hypothetical protein [Theileria orientalis strain Shintoku]BAM40324.1 conserved hypothetical protein [Theileria orientalis strain Shintoku]|eukprot:XP_009690625.1 conserved hypothetical protein [Theileria orientalis strain Shintoku]